MLSFYKVQQAPAQISSGSKYFNSSHVLYLLKLLKLVYHQNYLVSQVILASYSILSSTLTSYLNIYIYIYIYIYTYVCIFILASDIPETGSSSGGGGGSTGPIVGAVVGVVIVILLIIIVVFIVYRSVGLYPYVIGTVYT